MRNTQLVRRKDSGRPPPVPAKAKVAIAAMLAQPKLDFAGAAKAAGLTTYRLRQYLKLPHVARYFRAELQVVLDAICAGNPQALRNIRDEPRNQMAAVAAVRGTGIDAQRRAGKRPQRHEQQPSVVILIQGPPPPDAKPSNCIIYQAPSPAPPVIDVRPVAEFEPLDPR